MEYQTVTRAARHFFAAVAAVSVSCGAWAATVVWNGNAANGRLSDGGNWNGGAAPAAGDTLDFSNVSATTALNADFTDNRAFATLLVGSGELTLSSGTLNLTTLTNAYTLGVASGATLAISGDLVGYAARNTKSLLRSNEGTVTVGGLVRFRSSGTSKGESTVTQYASANDNSSPIIANGLAYHADSWSDYLVASLGSMNNGPGRWVIGAGGTSYPRSRDINYSGFRVVGQDVLLGSSADWTLAESYRMYGTDLYIRNAGKVTVDTSDYRDSTAPHTVTFEGYINEGSSLATALVVKGCGTLVLKNTTSGKDNVIANAFAVTETATLQINKGKSITGTGSVLLASGTKLLVQDASASVGLPSFAPAAGSTIVVSNLTAETPAILLSGSLTMPTEGQVTLKIGGATPLADGIYTIMSAANALPAETVDHLALDASEVVAGECSLYAKGGALLLLVGIAEPGYGIWVGGMDEKLSTAANWLNGKEPRAGDTLNFKAAPSGTILDADYGDTRIFATALFGAGDVTLGSGNLDVTALTNAATLAVAAGATLTVEGDLVAMPTEENGKVAVFLGANEGTVNVKGLARGYSTIGNSSVYQYDTVSANTQPIRAAGLAYNGTANPAQLFFRLCSKGGKPGKWIVGSQGFVWASGRNADYTSFYTEGDKAHVTLYSSADWTLANSGRYNTINGDIRVNGASLTLDTSDYDDPTVRHTITLNGRIRTTSSAMTNAVIVAGCGTVVVDTKGNYSGSEYPLAEDAKHSYIASGTTFAITNSATLLVKPGKKILGEGTISLAAGTTLAFESVDNTFETPDIVPVALPSAGAATIDIEGSRLRIGEYVLGTLASVPENLHEHVTVTGTALNGRKCLVKAVEATEDGKTVTQLVAVLKSSGFTLVLR